jgi:hypothetical protein
MLLLVFFGLIPAVYNQEGDVDSASHGLLTLYLFLTILTEIGAIRYLLRIDSHLDHIETGVFHDISTKCPHIAV